MNSQPGLKCRLSLEGRRAQLTTHKDALPQMNGPRFTQQTTAPSLPLTRHPAARPAPGPRAAHSGIFRGPLQLLLEEPGWNVLVPAIDLAMLFLAVVLALGGIHATLHSPPTPRRCWRCRGSHC